MTQIGWVLGFQANGLTWLVQVEFNNYARELTRALYLINRVTFSKYVTYLFKMSSKNNLDLITVLILENIFSNRTQFGFLSTFKWVF